LNARFPLFWKKKGLCESFEGEAARKGKRFPSPGNNRNDKRKKAFPKEGGGTSGR